MRIIVFGLKEVIRHIIFVEYLWWNIFFSIWSIKVRGLTIAWRLLSISLWVSTNLITLVKWPLNTKTLTFPYVTYSFLFLEKRLRPLLCWHCLASCFLNFLCWIIVKKCHLILGAVFGRIFYSHGFILDLRHFVSPFNRWQNLLIVLMHLLLYIILGLICFQVILIQLTFILDRRVMHLCQFSDATQASFAISLFLRNIILRYILV